MILIEDGEMSEAAGDVRCSGPPKSPKRRRAVDKGEEGAFETMLREVSENRLGTLLGRRLPVPTGNCRCQLPTAVGSNFLREVSPYILPLLLRPPSAPSHTGSDRVSLQVPREAGPAEVHRGQPEHGAACPCVWCAVRQYVELPPRPAGVPDRRRR